MITNDSCPVAVLASGPPPVPQPCLVCLVNGEICFIYFVCLFVAANSLLHIADKDLSLFNALVFGTISLTASDSSFLFRELSDLF